jgi:hypothetical protein
MTQASQHLLADEAGEEEEGRTDGSVVAVVPPDTGAPTSDGVDYGSRLESIESSSV